MIPIVLLNGWPHPGTSLRLVGGPRQDKFLHFAQLETYSTAVYLHGIDLRGDVALKYLFARAT